MHTSHPIYRACFVSSLLVVSALAACANDTPTSQADAGPLLDVPSADAAGDVTTADTAADLDVRLDADIPDIYLGPPSVGDHVTVTIDGGLVRGELVATYDHTIWWVPQDALTWAIFDPSRFHPYPADSSLVFIRQADILDVTAEPLPTTVTPYRELLRDRGIVFPRLPLEGPVYCITGNEAIHLEENGWGNFSWDFVLTNAQGNYWRTNGATNEDYLVWDAEVFLPLGGTLVAIENDQPDKVPKVVLPPEELDDPANAVSVRVDGLFAYSLLHLRQGTVPAELKVGDVVPAGTCVGRVGNSGVSAVPHLHMNMYWWDQVANRGWSVPAEFAGLHVRQLGDTEPAVQYPFVVPATGMLLSDQPF